MATMTFTDEEARYLGVLAERAHSDLAQGGPAYIGAHEADMLAAEHDVADFVVELVLDKLIDSGKIFEKSRATYDATPLGVWWEEHQERIVFRARNELRRELLRLAARARESGDRLRFQEEGQRFIDRSYAQVMAAARLLEDWGLIALDELLGRNFYLSITHEGYDLVGDQALLYRVLPVTATEDTEAHASVAPTALEGVVRSCKQVLEERGWESVAEELSRGDGQWAQGHWVDAVSEYYAAIESALKYRLDEAGVKHSPKAALKQLAKLAVQHGLMPRNYQALFGFADSIRSPRKHGRGPAREAVEVGPAEGLLMGNHARSLVLYLGHRPVV